MRIRFNGVSSIIFVQFVTVLIISSQLASGQEGGDEIDTDAGNGVEKDPAAKGVIASMLSTTYANLSVVFEHEIKKHLGFCILNVQKDWDDAFNFTSDTRFIEDCVGRTGGDLLQRLCTAADIKFYFASLVNRSSNYAKPNKNCNLNSWADGCEPGWACRVANDEKVDLRESKEMPLRTNDCAPCCAGFFCPLGLTCMMPCPLGAYCPSSTLSSETGLCDPYTYQPSPGINNHTCGTADFWADIASSHEMFCSAGSYCPSTIQEIPCKKGFFCRIGSTAPQGCFSLAKCDAESENQNIQAYGAMMFVALSVIVVIIYNCSDQVLSTQERRQAKSREKAVQSVRETQANEKWKSAKDIAKKHATGLQTQLSQTFSRKKSYKQPEQSRGTGQGKVGSEFPLIGTSEQLSAQESEGKKNETGSLTKMMHDIEDDPDSEDGFTLEIGEKNAKKGAPKGKQMHSRSRMFRYAYDQIEKEKAMQEEHKDLTFSGVISMAGDFEIRKRPMIEVAFKDLTLTLKGKNKHLMRCVTGKISPGRVSAVMGPSGAGKTTFLSALTGKAAGCSVTGLILVNGKSEPIHSYKKIIGFVPQDDIVHGNLTVEENLWFSARCRLPAELPKQEKVLVVERVIECLGLQPVRDSIVGTVEQRGISGGQKKRVNVGLEMVMEPSLLILDEPTSGLDSSSSQLLLRALRREALEGVNICMVVHQPSYTLFRMFDDLVLLAKGGLTVYHGSVRKVEQYFSGIGITVPDRVNPPDHYIDILEGIVKLNPNSGVTAKQLPVRWMLHNGYPVPLDMLEKAEGMAASSTASSTSLGESSTDLGSAEQSFAGDLWDDVKCNAEKKKDSIQYNFLSSRDLSNRKTPGAYVQYKHYLGRVAKQRLRESRTQAVDYLILCLAGVCLGTIAKMSDATFGVLGYTYTVIAVSLLCKIAALRSFSQDKLQYWRESSSGMSSLAYFLAKDTVDHFNTIIKPWVYLSMFYYCNNPRSSVVDNYTVLVCLVYCVTGIAYVFAICFEPGPAQLWCVLLPVVLTLVATQNSDGGFVKEVSNFAYPKWAMEAFVIANAERYSGVWLITRCGSLFKYGYDLNHWRRCLILLTAHGFIGRAIAYICMVTFQKK